MVYVVLILVFINVTFIYLVGSCMNSLHTAPLTKLMCVWAGIVLRNSIHNTIQDMMFVCHQWAMVDCYIVEDFWELVKGDCSSLGKLDLAYLF